MPTALGLAADRSIVPSDYHNPHLLTNICLVVIATSFAVLKTIGITPDAAAFGTFVWSHTFGFLLMARWLSAVFGAATVWLTYAITTRLGDRTAALAAAATIGVSFLHVRDSHFATNDILMTMLVAATTLASLTYFERPSLSRLVAAGALAGAACGAKYNGIIAVASVAVAILWTDIVRERRPGRFATSALAAAAAVVTGLVLTNPAALVVPRHVIGGFLQTSAMGLESFCCQRPEPVPWQMAQVLILGAGSAAMVAAAWGVVVAIRSAARPVLFVTLATPLAYVVVMARKDVFAARFMLLVLPFVAGYAGLGASHVSKTSAHAGGARGDCYPCWSSPQSSPSRLRDRSTWTGCSHGSTTGEKSKTGCAQDRARSNTPCSMGPRRGICQSAAFWITRGSQQ
jgi:hypothetical protein